jgi:hypothetical protein
MNIKNLPEINDRVFLMHREVVVTMVYAPFRLIKVHYSEEITEFYVDACALTSEPNYRDSISLGMLRRNFIE